jgi:hypothetical protein
MLRKTVYKKRHTNLKKKAEEITIMEDNAQKAI